MWSRINCGFANDEENASVANNDGQTGKDEGNEEEEFLGTLIVFVLHYGTTSNASIQVEHAPHFKQRRHQGTKGSHPNQNDHHYQMTRSVHPGKITHFLPLLITPLFFLKSVSSPTHSTTLGHNPFPHTYYNDSISHDGGQEEDGAPNN